jgi:hypothetical protein
MATTVEFEEVLAVLGADPSVLSGPERVAVLPDLQKLRGWLDAREARFLAVMHDSRDDVDAGARDLTSSPSRRPTSGTARQNGERCVLPGSANSTAWPKHWPPDLSEQHMPTNCVCWPNACPLPITTRFEADVGI